MKTSGQKIYILSFILLCIGILVLFLVNFKKDSLYFLTVKEVNSKALNDNSKVRIFGEVEKVEIDSKNGEVNFKLVDKKSRSDWILIKYKGFLPDTFRVGVDVIVEGKFEGDKTFFAQKLMTKCPSRYRRK